MVIDVDSWVADAVDFVASDFRFRGEDSLILFGVVVVCVDESPGAKFVGFGDPFCGVLRDDAVALQFVYGFELRSE